VHARTMQAVCFLFLVIFTGICSKSLTCAVSGAEGGEPVAGPSAPSDAKSDSSSNSDSAGEKRVYEVRKKVADFPDKEDLSTPESAYASIERAYAAEGIAAFHRLSVPEIAAKTPGSAKQPPPKEVAERFLNAEILEVHIWNKINACVIAQTTDNKRNYDLRFLKHIGGQWLNDGNDSAGTIEQSHNVIARIRSYEAVKRLRDERPPVADPAAHLQPFVDFLKREGKDPQEFVTDALEKHRVVIMGEIHHRQSYWAFDAALARSPEFARRVGVIYLELPSNDQGLVDSFLAADKYNPEPIIEMLRDMMTMGWPDQPTLDFFRTVWEVNQKLPEPQRLRIVLADMARPWKEMLRRGDWRKYEVDRDQCMAENIIRDLSDHAADKRNALFIAGYMHAKLNITYPGGLPMKTAGWHLREKLGEDNVYAIFPHGPVMTNSGEVSGRLALGLFETAFAAMGKKPMAFPLDHGPFGKMIFDSDPDMITGDPYSKGFQGFLYLGPLENEIFSPLIPGFYSDEFVKEIDRRMWMMEGRGLMQSGMKNVDGAEYTANMNKLWGQTRRNWATANLGPLNAWHYGSHWEDVLRKQKQENAMQYADEVQAAAQRLFQAIRAADYNRDWQIAGQWQHFLPEDIDYTVNHDFPGWVNWICAKFKTNPIVDVQLGKVFLDGKGRPAVNYELKLKDGEVLRGDLPFQWNPKTQQWEGLEGLDWHITNASWMERLQQGIGGYLPKTP
jgi:hypothetical protein